jgi:hypothetical protein
MSKHTDRARIAKLIEIYNRLPRMQCRRLCGDEVCGAIFMTAVEADRVRRATHQVPRTTPTMCVYLERGACRVYDQRPLICRVFGLVKRMSCPHGCVPDRWLSDHEFVEIARAVEQIGGPNVITARDGLRRFAGSFTDLDTTRMSPELADHYAELTRGLRAIHHGRVIGIAPSSDRGSGWTSLTGEERKGDKV